MTPVFFFQRIVVERSFGLFISSRQGLGAKTEAFSFGRVGENRCTLSQRPFPGEYDLIRGFRNDPVGPYHDQPVTEPMKPLKFSIGEPFGELLKADTTASHAFIRPAFVADVAEFLHPGWWRRRPEFINPQR